MFPVRDDNPTLRPAVVTIFLLVVNSAAWLFVERLGDPGAVARSVCRFGLTPAALLASLPAETVVPLGPGLTCRLAPSDAWFTPLTSMFMHGSWFHIVGNLWFLWIFGNNVEDVLGRLRFLVFYLLCGLVAAAVQTASHPASMVPMVGASGAIGGVMGAYCVLYPRAHVYTVLLLGLYVRTVAVPAAVMLIYWFVLQLLGGIPALQGEGGGIAFWAHVGGFAAGVVLVFVFRNPTLVAAHRRATLRTSAELG